jgi:hypothetical protein
MDRKNIVTPMLLLVRWSEQYENKIKLNEWRREVSKEC